MTEREFELGDILSITTSRLVSDRLIDGVTDILCFMTDDILFTHQLSRAYDECRPSLLNQHPQLTRVVVPENFEDTAHVKSWLVEQELVYGKSLTVRPLADGEHKRIHPMVESADMIGPEKSLVFNTEDPKNSFDEISKIVSKT